MAILYPTSLANLVVEVGTRHCHQTLLSAFSASCGPFCLGHDVLKSAFHVACSRTISARIILWMRPANERRRYIVMPSLIGWVHTQKYPFISHKRNCRQCWNYISSHNSFCTELCFMVNRRGTICQESCLEMGPVINDNGNNINNCYEAIRPYVIIVLWSTINLLVAYNDSHSGAETGIFH